MFNYRRIFATILIVALCGLASQFLIERAGASVFLAQPKAGNAVAIGDENFQGVQVSVASLSGDLAIVMKRPDRALLDQELNFEGRALNLRSIKAKAALKDQGRDGYMHLCANCHGLALEGTGKGPALASTALHPQNLPDIMIELAIDKHDERLFPELTAADRDAIIVFLRDCQMDGACEF